MSLRALPRRARQRRLRAQDARWRLRILGAFAKGRRTGTFLFWSSTGARIAVVPYDDDAKVGTVAVWYAPAPPRGEPRRKLEAAYCGRRAPRRHAVVAPNGAAANGVSLRTREASSTATAWSESGAR
jgi:hypothetical protein